MQIEITLKNYRCFPDTHPARIVLDRGFAALVGVNNSGKSSLLKFFYELRPLFSKLNETFVSDPFKQQSLGMATPLLNELFCRANDRPLEIGIRTTPSDDQDETTDQSVATELSIICPRMDGTYKVQIKTDTGYLSDATEVTNKGSILWHRDKPIANLNDLSRAWMILGNCMYIGPFRNALNLSPNLHEQDRYFDIEVGQLFIRGWRTFQTGPYFRHREAADRLLREVGHLFGYQELLALASSDEKTLQLVIDRKSYSLPEVGSGLAQFVVTLANVAKGNPTYILIDEPESNLHPSLQLDFLMTIGSYASEGVVFATHSIGLARASADRIYSVQKSADGTSRVNSLEQTPRLAEFLGELNFSGYRELGFSKILLVEGATEVQTLQQFLRHYRKDHKIVLLPLSGRSGINAAAAPQLEEVLRITTDVYALVDSERSAADAPVAPDIEAFRQVCEKLDIKCHVLDRRALENYFPDPAVKRVMGDNYRALAHYEERKAATPVWGKSQNWRIAREMTPSELEGTDDLARFLSDL